MAQTLENLASSEINWVYTGKNIAQYLHITVPEAPPEWKKITRNWTIGDAIFGGIEKLHSTYLFLFDRKGYKEKKKYVEQEEQTRDLLHQAREQDEVEFEDELRKCGILTEQEKDAYMVAHFAGLAMSRFVYHADENKGGVEVVKRRNGVAEEVRITPELFEDYVRISINDGIKSLISKYWISIKSVEMPQIINPDFHEKATFWLAHEVYSRTDENKECKLLETVVVKRENDGRFNLRTFYGGSD